MTLRNLALLGRQRMHLDATFAFAEDSSVRTAYFMSGKWILMTAAVHLQIVCVWDPGQAHTH